MVLVVQNLKMSIRKCVREREIQLRYKYPIRFNMVEINTIIKLSAHNCVSDGVYRTSWVVENLAKKKLFHWPFNRLSHIFCRLNESKDAKSVFHSVSESANERKKEDEKKSNCNRCNSDHSFLDNIITNYTIRC